MSPTSSSARETSSPLPVGNSPIESVLLARRFGPYPRGFSFTATSLPGHLVQLVLSGEVRQQCNGRDYNLHPGCLIWYHEDEWVTGKVLGGSWEFYSVNFIAPTLPPPSFESRLFPKTDRQVRERFTALLASWNDLTLPIASREFRVHAALLEILSRIPRSAEESAPVDPRARLWWEIETRARQCLHEPITLRSMQQWSHRSAATIARSCKRAVGISPLERLKIVRMSLSRGLVRNSTLSMNEIAERVGYARVHEFSRAYRRHFGVPPTAERKRATRGL